MSTTAQTSIAPALASCEAWKAFNQHVITCRACRVCAPCMAGDQLLAAAEEFQAAAAATGHLGGPLHD